MRRLSVLLGLLLVLAVGRASAEAHPSPWSGWRTLASERISVQYAPPDRALAEQALAIAVQSLPQIESFLRWKTSTHIYINLVDVQDAPNGWATMLPFNQVTLYTTPATRAGELADYSRWLRLILAHELTHVVHLDKGGGAPDRLRRVFGRFPLLFPNAWQPNLFTEGLATWVETDRDAGFGRGQSAQYRMMMRAEVENGLLPLGEVQQYRSEWPMNHAYLYGVYFYIYLESVYGKGRIPDYIDDYSTHLLPWMLSASSRQVSGRNINALWQDYLAWLQQQFRPEIEALQQAGPTPAERVTHRGYVTGRPVALAAGRLAWVDVGLTGPSYIVARDVDGIEYRLTRAEPDARLVGVAGGQLYFLQDAACGERRVTRDLFRVDAAASRGSSMRAHALGNGLALGRDTRVTRCGRYLHAAISPEGARLAAVQARTGTQRLVLRGLGEDAREAELWAGGSDEQVADLAWLDERTLVASVKRADMKWALFRMDIGERTWQPIALDLPRGNRQTPFVDPATQQVWFTSDHTGVPDLYRTDAEGREVVRVTRSLTGSMDPWVDGDRVHYVRYTPQGWDIFSAPSGTVLPADAPVLPPLQPRGAGMHLAWPREDRVDARAGNVVDRRYHALPSMLPRSWFLGGFSTGDAQELGAMTNGADALGFYQYVAGVAQEFGIDRASGMIEGIAWNHWLLGYQRRYEIVGNGLVPGDPGFAVDAYVLQEDTRLAGFMTLPFAFSELTPWAGLQASSDRIHDLRPGSARPLRDIDVDTVGAGLVYASSRQYLHGVSESHGRRVKLALERDTLSVRDVSGTGVASSARSAGDVFALDWREYLSLGGRHVLALRGFSGRADPGADAFRLGEDFSMLQTSAGFVHERDVALRGYPDTLPELFDVNADLFSAEWRIPLPAINRGIDGLPLGAHTAYATLFYDAGSAWGTAPNPVRRADATVFDSVGAEAVVVIDIGYSMLPMQLRLGYARALVDDPRVDRTNIYLVLGAAF